MAVQAAILPLLLQAIWVVDDNGGPGVNFTDIPPAVAAAADGDIVLVKAGVYSHFTVSGKGLRILGAGQTTTVVSAAGTNSWKTTVSAVPAGSIVYVDRMKFDGNSNHGPRIGVSGATTRVALADVMVVGPRLDFGFGCTCSFLQGCAALRAEGAQVFLFRGMLTGSAGGCGLCGSAGGGIPLFATAGASVHVTTSSLTGGSGGTCDCGILCYSSGAVAARFSGTGASIGWIADSVLVGGQGLCPVFGSSQTSSGGAGLSVNSSAVRVSGGNAAYVVGGSGGGGLSGGAGVPGPGIGSSGSAAVTIHSVAVTGGTTTCFPPSSAPMTTGPGIILGATPLPVLRVSGNLTLTGSATVSFTNGPPNAPFLIGMAFEPGFASGGPFFLGEILIDPVNWFPLFGGNLSPAGDVTVTFPLTGIAPSFAYTPVFLQGIALDPSGTFWRVSNSTVATLRP